MGHATHDPSCCSNTTRCDSPVDANSVVGMNVLGPLSILWWADWGGTGDVCDTMAIMVTGTEWSQYSQHAQ